ncbi:alpha/beta fold hydrolase [Hymenobacter sp. B81]|uniref:alpha/beta fold hydrolase n=1 Tax=Hymenobacter sp. B81 TaxID=3344878 RepID=UPI0037DC65DD
MTAAETVARHETNLAGADYFLRVLTLRGPDPAADQRPWLVFLHDSLGCIALWRDFPVRLAAATSCHALVYDRRGYGQSAPLGEGPRPHDYHAAEVPDLWRVLDLHGIERAVLVGHSDGGTIALQAAALGPERVSGVVTEGAHVFVEEETLAGIRQARQLYQTTDLPARLARYHGPKTEAVFRAWTDTWLRPDFRSWNVEEYLPRVQCPVLVLQGAADEYGTWAQVDAITAQTGGPSRSERLPGVGHTPHKEAPAATLGLMTDFVNSVVAPV